MFFITIIIFILQMRNWGRKRLQSCQDDPVSNGAVMGTQLFPPHTGGISVSQWNIRSETYPPSNKVCFLRWADLIPSLQA